MYDMLNAQMMTFGGELDTVSAAVTELQGNTVKRCMYSRITVAHFLPGAKLGHKILISLHITFLGNVPVLHVASNS